MSNPAEYKFRFDSSQNVSSFGADVDGKTIFELEQKVVDDLNKFYSTFYSYWRCSNTTKNITIPSGSNMSASQLNTTYNCSNSKTSDNVTADYNGLLNSIKQLNNALAKIKESNYTFPGIDDIQTNYNNVLKLRNELDIKMADLNRLPGTPSAQYKASHDSTVYASIVWSVLATSLIYYVFVHL